MKIPILTLRSLPAGLVSEYLQKYNNNIPNNILIQLIFVTIHMFCPYDLVDLYPKLINSSEPLVWFFD
jgi:hypothetical protein